MVGARTRHNGNVIDMSTRLRRVLCVAMAAAVVGLVLVCVSLVHHEGGSVAVAHGSSTSATVSRPGSTVPEPASGDQCSMSELVACVRVSASPFVGLVLLALVAVALVTVGRVRTVRRTWRGAWGLAPSTLSVAPALTALCISRT